jgi:hypothetical protein
MRPIMQPLRSKPSHEQKKRTSKLAIISCALGIVDVGVVPTPQPVFSFLTRHGTGWEVVGLVGLAGLVYLLLLAGALVTGHLAKRLIRRSQGALGGSFSTTTGLVLGYFSLFMFVGNLLTAGYL